MTEDRMLQEAVKAIDNGQLARARDLLTRLLRQDQSNVAYWLYMSAVVETTKERTFCLENALKYDPENKTAVQGLVMLGAMSPDTATPRVRPVNERQREVPNVIEEAAGESARRKKVGLSPVQIGSLAFFGLAAIALVVFGIIGNPFYSGTQYAYQGSTLAPLLTSGPTPTYLPTHTPEPGAISNITGPTPLVFQLDATYTPTPRYIDTPHPVISAFDSGMSSLDAGNYEMAIEFLNQADDAAPESIDIIYYLGQAYLLNGDYELARSAFDRVLQIDSTFAPAHLGLARAFLGMNPELDVTVHLYRATEFDPEYIDARLAWAEYKIMQEEYDEAMDDVEIALSIDPESPGAYSVLAKLYIVENMPEEALEAAEEAYQRDLVNIDNYLLYAHALILNERYDEAIPLLETYLSHMEEDYFAWYLLGRAYQGAGYPEVSLEIFRNTYAEKRDIYEMSYYWGLALIDTEDYYNAIERLFVPIQRTPRWFEPYVAQAQAYYLNGQPDRAKEVLESGKDRAITDRQKAALYYWRGIIYTALGYPEIAEPNWEALLALPPSEVPTEWWSEAQTALGTSAPATTPAAATPTRVASPTPNP